MLAQIISFAIDTYIWIYIYRDIHTRTYTYTYAYINIYIYKYVYINTLYYLCKHANAINHAEHFFDGAF